MGHRSLKSSVGGHSEAAKEEVLRKDGLGGRKADRFIFLGSKIYLELRREMCSAGGGGSEKLGHSQIGGSSCEGEGTKPREKV